MSIPNPHHKLGSSPVSLTRNINLGGRFCHSIFDRNYTVDITNKQVLDTVFGLLLVPEFTDPINTVVTLNFYWDEVAFREVKKHIEKYASKGREELGKEILGE
jgi:ubiquitin-protein ligase